MIPHGRQTVRPLPFRIQVVSVAHVHAHPLGSVQEWLGRRGDRKGAAMARTKYAAFRAADYLDDDEVIAEYLTVAAEDENPDVLLAALAEVAKARGMARVAADAGLGRESLHKALAPGAHPRFETISAVLRALNVRIELHPLTPTHGA
jgi:probable addiction module antidote protein